MDQSTRNKKQDVPEECGLSISFCLIRYAVDAEGWGGVAIQKNLGEVPLIEDLESMDFIGE